MGPKVLPKSDFWNVEYACSSWGSSNKGHGNLAS